MQLAIPLIIAAALIAAGVGSLRRAKRPLDRLYLVGWGLIALGALDAVGLALALSMAAWLSHG